MKKITLVLMTLLCLMGLVGCGGGSKAENAPATKKAEAAESLKGKKALVVYFSYSGQTAKVAKAVQEATKADIFEVKTVQPYPQGYHECTDYAKAEKARNFHPEIQGNVPNIKDYDVVYMGFPIWWHDAPMAIYTFIDKHDLSGKTVVSFCTSGGSPISESTPGLRKALPSSKFVEGLRFYPNDTAAVNKWVESLNL